MHPQSLDFLLGDYLYIFYHSKFSIIIIYPFSGTIWEICSTRRIWFRNYWTRWSWNTACCFWPWVSIQIKDFATNHRWLLWLLSVEGSWRNFPFVVFFPCILKPKYSILVSDLKIFEAPSQSVLFHDISLGWSSSHYVTHWFIGRLFSIVCFPFSDWFYLVAGEEDDNQWTDSMKFIVHG